MSLFTRLCEFHRQMLRPQSDIEGSDGFRLFAPLVEARLSSLRSGAMSLRKGARRYSELMTWPWIRLFRNSLLFRIVIAFLEVWRYQTE